VLVSRFTSTANYRNHRKIVVIDGRVGYTGGVNIADRYIYGRKNVGGIWRDTHLRVEGEAVAMLQAIFTTDWSFVTDGELLSDATYFPPTDVTDVVPMQIATSGPDTKFAAIMQSYYAAICKAEKYIYISTPYLLPNQVIVTALQVAAMSGVDVRIAIPVRGDNIFVAWAGYSYIDALMDAGVKVYLYKKGFIHSKFIVIDDELCTIGSANLDNRSFDDDFEVQAIIYENSVAKELRGYFMNDLADSELITRQSWEGRSRLSKIMEPICRLLAPIF
jgi:cardiolipin synthase